MAGLNCTFTLPGMVSIVADLLVFCNQHEPLKLSNLILLDSLKIAQLLWFFVKCEVWSVRMRKLSNHVPKVKWCTSVQPCTSLVIRRYEARTHCCLGSSRFHTLPMGSCHTFKLIVHLDKTALKLTNRGFIGYRLRNFIIRQRANRQWITEATLNQRPHCTR